MSTKKRPTRRSGNPPESEWYSTPAARRARKPKGFTLSAEAIERLERLAAEHHEGNLSATVEAALESYDRAKSRTRRAT